MFQEINIRDLPENAVSLIADRWLLITAGNKENYNMMTGSWGALGEMWGKDIAVTVIRPTRYTYEFMEQEEYFTLSILNPEISKAVHSVCGSKSGREVNKTKETDLTPIFDQGVYFEQADIVLICKKIYISDVKPENFLDQSLDEKWYNNDYHRMYVGEIVKTLVKK
ncbi:MAG: flavin reductase [Clostridia bacterium]|nr:flavin reductase [Clostridia bacterium]